MTYSLAFDDIKYYLNAWPDNSAVTPAQRAYYPAECNLLDRLPKDHPETLRLLKVDGGDDQPVNDHSETTCKHYNWDKNNRKWPNDESLVRLCAFLHLTPERSLILVLKTQCEVSFRNEIYGTKIPLIADHQSLIQLFEGTIVGGCSYIGYASGAHWSPKVRLSGTDRKVGFHPPGRCHRASLEETFALLEKYGLSDGYDFELFASMADGALRNGLFICHPNGAEVTRFTDYWRGEMTRRDGASTALRERHYVARLNLVVLERDYEEALWQDDKLSFEIEGTHARYFAKLGDLEIQHAESVIEKENLSRQIALKEAAPSLTREQCAERAKAGLGDSMDKLEQLRTAHQEGLLLEIFGPMIGTPIDDPEKSASYEKECRRLIAEIDRISKPLRKYTHPDGKRLDRFFTPAQSQRLDGYFRAAQGHIDRLKQVKGMELCLGNRSLEHLANIRARVEEIMRKVLSVYAEEGLSVSLQHLPPENVTLAQLCDLLEVRANGVEQDIGHMRDRMASRRNDPTYREQVNTIASEASIATARGRLEVAIAVLVAELPPLRERLDHLFAVG